MKQVIMLSLFLMVLGPYNCYKGITPHKCYELSTTVVARLVTEDLRMLTDYYVKAYLFCERECCAIWSNTVKTDSSGTTVSPLKIRGTNYSLSSYFNLIAYKNDDDTVCYFSTDTFSFTNGDSLNIIAFMAGSI